MWKANIEILKLKIDGNEKILEIQMKIGQDNGKKLIRMIDTAGGHYGVILERRKKSNEDFELKQKWKIVMQESTFFPNMKHVESEIGKVVFQHKVDIPYVAPATVSVATSTTSPLVATVVTSDDED